MPRAIWTGVISFGLVSIPVKLFAATESRDVSFNQLHKNCKTRIKEMRWCPHCERQVDWEEVTKGYEFAKGEYIEITPADLEELPVPGKQMVSVGSFVELSEIDPIFFDKTYYLEPEESSAKSFGLFMQAVHSKKLVGVGTVAIRTKERYCCLRTVGNTLVLNTLLYPDEIRVDTTQEMKPVKVSPQEMKMANSLIDMMKADFNPDEYQDHYREAVEAMVEAKLKGKETVKASVPKGGKVLDLMDALQASLERASGSKQNGKNKSPRLVAAKKVKPEKSQASAKTAARTKSKAGRKAS
jgi:DNA end-binding protein Ku